ncbi:NAD(P)H-dependent oxidoreductase [Alkalitalea saponilacus]|uniref:Putative NADPH-quinone reductase (Modulator of drug activity B) n=1 Tax=Alkalitalea saponilacus TaxID=889453 RepID=A0A1T5HRX5_9BACT|nr:NAD(P)H-dependent oxidoreductase [Alkalitalea saponilacus]ASB50048.1 NADPH:quinone reductase [Alkalitalea saponilacus]SKC23436.1 Putative NADPH-quinone reductase (modulator of drug activity B) [Alkalitalea saponilacus]
MKKILIINGHPDKESFCADLATTYKNGAQSTKSDCKLVNLIDLNFNLNLQYGYRKRTELEPDLLQIQQDILDSDHLVFVYPTWWGTYPALLKGFIDRVFLPDFSFKYRNNSLLWDKLLKGKSARLIVTMDTPKWFYALIYKNPGHNSMKKGILEFCGVKPVKISALGPIKTSNEKKRQDWLNKVEKLGQRHN